MIVEQFLPAFHYGDAIGQYTLHFHQYLCQQGIESRIVALTIDENMRDQAVYFKDYHQSTEAVKILHFAVPSPLTDYFLAVKGKKALIYHNITPANFFVDFSDELVHITHEGRNQLQRLRGCFDISISDSTYNAEELAKLGFPNIHVFPVMIDRREYQKLSSIPYYHLLTNERKNIIFVGRISPNKKIEDLIKLIFFYKKYLSPAIRLIVAGNCQTMPKYYLALRDLAARFLLTNEDILFTGHLPFDELLSVYKVAHLFLSLSEHEGFCLPLIESCFFELPVMAYDCGAVAETLSDSGILLKKKNIAWIATTAEEVINNPQLNTSLKNKARQRTAEYIQQSDPGRLLSLIQSI